MMLYSTSTVASHVARRKAEQHTCTCISINSQGHNFYKLKYISLEEVKIVPFHKVAYFLNFNDLAYLFIDDAYKILLHNRKVM